MTISKTVISVIVGMPCLRTYPEMKIVVNRIVQLDVCIDPLLRHQNPGPAIFLLDDRAYICFDSGPPSRHAIANLNRIMNMNSATAMQRMSYLFD